MISIKRALNNDRVMKATTGLTASEFNHLAKSFGQELENEGRIRYEREVEQGNRARKPGGGRLGNLRSVSEKLVSILFYFKYYLCKSFF